MDIWPVQPHRVPHIQGDSPTLGLELCSCCHEILNNSVSGFAFLSEVWWDSGSWFPLWSFPFLPPKDALLWPLGPQALPACPSPPLSGNHCHLLPRGSHWRYSPVDLITGLGRVMVRHILPSCPRRSQGAAATSCPPSGLAWVACPESQHLMEAQVCPSVEIAIPWGHLAPVAWGGRQRPAERGEWPS